MVCYNWILTVGVPDHLTFTNQNIKSKQDAEVAAVNEYAEELQMIGFGVYFVSLGACFVALIVFKFYQGKTWENVSVRCGIYLIKAAIMVTGPLSGPLVYTSLLI